MVLQSYLDTYKAAPEEHIDSIDWATAQATNTVEAFEKYLEQHPSGEYTDEANDKINSFNAQTVQPEEKLMVGSTFRNFFTAINNKDEDMLSTCVGRIMTSFLGKPDATRSDVLTFMKKIYKPTVASMTWASLADYNISKKEIGEEKYEYSVNFNATQAVNNSDGTQEKNKYRISAKINPDGLITELNMTKILE